VWNGEAVEGFVVRTHVVKPKDADVRETAASPYPPGSTFFFKVKFDEPYMMYRDWRELTKTLLSTKGSLNDAKLSTMRMKRPETRLYVKWVKEQIQKDRSQFDEYSKGKGIIRTRERFLEWLEASKAPGSGNAREKTPDVPVETTPVDVKPATEFGKTIIVPVAVPGCGTSTSVGRGWIS
jgi:tRNA ligase